MRHRKVGLAGAWCAAVLALLVSSANPAWTAVKGPDAGGYTATDSAIYSFIDISGASGGTSIFADTDDGTAALTMPFAFPFYGQTYTMACISVNGAISFVTNPSACGPVSDFANTDITAVAPPGDRPAVLPFWSDLTFQMPGAGSVFYQTLGAPGSRRFVVQWHKAYPQESANPVTFQVVLSEGTGAILFQYKGVNLGGGNPASNGAQATIGIRNAAGVSSHQQIEWSFDAPVLRDGTALAFSRDVSAPVTTAALDGPAGRNGWYYGPVKVTLSAVDQGGAVAATLYRLDDGRLLTYSAPFTVTGDGMHQLTYSSRDELGNQEQPRVLGVPIDGKAPAVSAAARPSSLWPANGKRVKVIVSGATADATSGIDPASGRFSVVDEYGKVEPRGAVTIGAGGRFSAAVPLVASRKGTDKDGRRFTIVIKVRDKAGHLGSASAVVRVPHDRGCGVAQP